MKKWIALILALTMMFTLAACGGNDDAAANDNADDSAELVYAVEAGSAGEAAALENSWNVNSVVDQATALMEVASGTSDAAIIDLLMAGAMIGEGTSYPDLTYTDKLTTEEYGVGCRKGSDLVDVINAVFSATYADGSMKDIAKVYGVQESLCEQAADLSWEAAADGDV
ncbi:MAG: transporter substrate-binding domain-containing protein, partial [Oscillospiraceae bacterium]|nr:transporter substrate-binding domain-containing protein [Oscillospiraceae bacterium]